MISLTTKTRRPTGCGKSRAVESEENQKQVFLPSHRPWKSRKTRGIPTFPTAPTAAGISQTTSGNLIVVDRKECLTPDTRPSESIVIELQNMSRAMDNCVMVPATGSKTTAPD
jgi:hypothetical protein